MERRWRADNSTSSNDSTAVSIFRQAHTAHHPQPPFCIPPHSSLRPTQWRPSLSGARLAHTFTGPLGINPPSYGVSSLAAWAPSWWYAPNISMEVWHRCRLADRGASSQVVAPPVRRYFGDGPRSQIPLTYPGEYEPLHARTRWARKTRESGLQSAARLSGSVKHEDLKG